MTPTSLRAELVIMGMRSNDCRERIIALLEGVDGVQEVDVNLHRGLATVLYEAPCDLGHLAAAIVTAGFGLALHSHTR